MSSASADFRPADIGRRREMIRAGDLVLDVKNIVVWVGGEPVALRLREFALLALLASRSGQPRSRRELAAEVWGESAEEHSPRSLDVHIRRVRTALAEKSSHEYIRTVRGFGFCFAPKEHPDTSARAHSQVGNRKISGGR